MHRDILRVQLQCRRLITPHAGTVRLYRQRLPLIRARSCCGKFRKRGIGCKQILQLRSYYCLSQTDNRPDIRVARAAADTDNIFARLQLPRRIPHVVGCHVRRVKYDPHCLPLSRQQQSCFRKAGQLLIRLLQLSARHRDINLHNLAPCIFFSSIFHRCRHRNLSVLRGHTVYPDRKGGVAQAVAETVFRFHAEGIKIAVADIDAVFIVLVVQIAVILTELRRGRIVGILLCPGIGQLARRNPLSGQHIGDGTAAGISELSGQKQRVYALYAVQHGKVDHAAHVEQHNALFIMGGKKTDGPFLAGREPVIPFPVDAILPLAGIARNHKNCRVRFRFGHVRFRDFRRIRLKKRVVEHQADHPFRMLPCHFINFFQIILLRLLIQPVVMIQPPARRHRKARCSKPLLDIYNLPRVHIAGPGTSLDGVPRPRPVQGDAAARRKREHSVIFQQNHAFRCKAAHLLLIFSLQLCNLRRGQCVKSAHPSASSCPAAPLARCSLQDRAVMMV